MVQSNLLQQQHVRSRICNILFRLINCVCHNNTLSSSTCHSSPRLFSGRRRRQEMSSRSQLIFPTCVGNSATIPPPGPAQRFGFLQRVNCCVIVPGGVRGQIYPLSMFPLENCVLHKNTNFARFIVPHFTMLCQCAD